MPLLTPEVVESYVRAAAEIGEDTVTFLADGVIYTVVLLPEPDNDCPLTRQQLEILCHAPQQFLAVCNS